MTPKREINLSRSKLSKMKDNEMTPFEGNGIRKVWHNEEWFFSIIDVIEILTETDRPRKYWSDLKKKLVNEGYNETSEKIGQLKMKATDGKNRLTDCANTEGIFRIIMSIPSPKVEPLRLWLAQVGKERIDETENPELTFERMTEVFRAKGYTDEWIKERLQSIETRKLLTDEWKNRGVKEGQEYSILTAIIAKGTFGLTPKEHKELKSLTKPSQNLRDHMTDLELIFTALGEATTRRLAINEDAQGFNENKNKAIKGGKAAGTALDAYEVQTGINVLSSENFLKPLKGDKPDELPPEKTD
jgi:DNA-damage-inducible protein D